MFCLVAFVTWHVRGVQTSTPISRRSSTMAESAPLSVTTTSMEVTSAKGLRAVRPSLLESIERDYSGGVATPSSL